MLAFADSSTGWASTPSEPEYLMSQDQSPVKVSIRVVGSGYKWMDSEFRRKVLEAMELEAGWAGPGSRPVSTEALVGVLEFIRRRLPRSAPRPSMVPTALGGLQLEWHRPGLDVEVEFDETGHVCDVAVIDQRRGIDRAAESLWEIVDDIQVALKQADELAD